MSSNYLIKFIGYHQHDNNYYSCYKYGYTAQKIPTDRMKGYQGLHELKKTLFIWYFGKQYMANKLESFIKVKLRQNTNLHFLKQNGEYFIITKPLYTEDSLQLDCLKYRLEYEESINIEDISDTEDENTESESESEEIIPHNPLSTHKLHREKFVNFDVNNASHSKYTGTFNGVNINNNNELNRLVIYWVYDKLCNENYDKLNSMVRSTLNKEKMRMYRNEHTDKYYVADSNTKTIWKNIMHIKDIAESHNINFNLDSLYVETYR